MSDTSKNANPKLIYLGAAKSLPNGQYGIRKPALIGYHSWFLCPKCGRPVHLTAKNPGIESYPCKHCETKVVVRSIPRENLKPMQPQTAEKTEKQQQGPTKPLNGVTAVGGQETQGGNMSKPSPPTERFRSHKLTNAKVKLVWGGLFARSSYVLQEGENWIGRWSEEEPSDVKVKDDYLSRRSACIEVIRQERGSLFKFTVKRATNPVKVNGKRIEVDDSIYLNFDDRIEMGNTVFVLKQVKQKKA